MKKHEKTIGPKLIYISLAITFVLWLFVPGKIALIFTEPWTALNQIAALLGTVLFSWTMLLATRLKFLEDWFGGLDKVYIWHKYTGQYGAALILLHPLGLAFHNSKKFIKWFIPTGRSIPVDLGVVAFWIFAYIVALTLLFRQLRLKYHVWKWLHVLLTFAFIIAFVHVSLIGSDLAVFLPLRIWIKFFTIVGVFSGLYKFLFYKFLAPHYTYEVTQVKKLGNVYDIRLKPVGEKMQYIPGQFSFVRFKSKNISSEEHPFCMAALPEDPELRYVIKELGDFTSTLHKLQPGDKAVIYGPYGRISKKYFDEPQKDAVFIAGGVGIAPFLAMSRTAPRFPNRNLYLYWCTRYANEAVFDNELRQLAQKYPNFYYKNHTSREGNSGKGAGHITAQHILADIRNPQNTLFFMCAPVPMMKDLHKQLLQAGIPRQNLIWEDFEML